MIPAPPALPSPATMASRTQTVAAKAKQKLSSMSSKAQPAIEFAHQSEHLGQYTVDQENQREGSTHAVEAKFITSQDPVIATANGGRLPAVPVEEAIKLNKLRDVLDNRDPSQNKPVDPSSRETNDGTVHGAKPSSSAMSERDGSKPDATLRDAVPPSRTNPLFPPLPMDPNQYRPFYEEELRRKEARKKAEKAWKQRQQRNEKCPDKEHATDSTEDYPIMEGGPDPLVCDVSYYARRVGLDCETFLVQTEDGFIIELWHIYDPRDYRPASSPDKGPHSPEIFRPGFAAEGAKNGASGSQFPFGQRKYPVLMMHGLLQSSGAFCSNDDKSMAFFLAKSGYDVWLGNNRCGFTPRHNMLKYEDPRMWAWNIRQMGVMDLPALISRVLSETGFEKLALIAHSQGTTETFVMLAKEQRPEIGEKISVFCALAPAVYAGPLIGKMYFKFMQVISPGMFRVIFGIHAFIPFMMHMHKILPGKFYGAMGYRIFSFLFNWTDERWEKDLRNRMFQFAPVFVSSESMRWWLGRECFARQKCILATRREKEMEEKEDDMAERQEKMRQYYRHGSRNEHSTERRDDSPSSSSSSRSQSPAEGEGNDNRGHYDHRGRHAWYDERVPPMALWVAGNDDLVDGRRLLRRFECGREPYVDVVHSKIIEGYEHLDVIWAMDALDKVGKEVREVIWRTAPEEARRACKMPSECQDLQPYKRMNGRIEVDDMGDHRARTGVDASAGEWIEEVHRQTGDMSVKDVATA
ncbi:uncharacterized protein K452DRAFT_314775 [Aplosporella prunicola CBS 121167]|uniref:Partial AB-hydrolase lipase domain-containing protein n=1 Tax=Aplosporella prunicola CBS 121167 TaxID=1176127 RepID=A0A6A6BRU5_9PEZI|nr:uncharacterized protein K452DRAFT_314775 [Aplosporella prunicola CBS 121167]KAF2146508.1 hypothetical protein K452DRAFT_314775 [Aplosporella prunicola CBS 121167]